MLKPSTFRSLIAVSAALAALAGCAVGPTYSGPAQLLTTAWRSPLPHGGQGGALHDWWAQFNDPALTRLVDWAEADSPSLSQAWVRIEQARAALTSTNAGALPTVNASGSAARSRQQAGSQAATTTVKSAGLDASWEIDLFGRVRRNAEAASARVEAREADWHDARVSLAAEVADTYVRYRACGLLAEVYERELTSVSATEATTASMVKAGFTAPAEGALARASLSSARSTAVRQRADCALLLKSLVYLTGQDEPALLSAMTGSRDLPQPAALNVDSVPANVLRQRPDLASLERELAASSAEIGAARADLYPSLSLGGSISRNTVSGTSYTAWSFGPQLSLPIFDGGRGRTAVDSAKASYAGALAGYRQGVRAAVREVEEALVNLDSTCQLATEAQRSTEEYRRYFNATEANWRAGTASLLPLEEARRSALSAEVQDLTLRQSQVSYWIALYKALGGGWTAGSPITRPFDAAAAGLNTSKNPQGATP
ncbi:efflux transporter outer membrane subunit [Pelomonas cellulosilytica]|uniref:Efflux transporter outer membrane subunit n=1 Tax=Pelomonas cellulosilytica TaxID=2906762 RepID=A0ABS8XVF1_9BURK|nr:efflux transporter outer membrane subunit [Pelomonas sp. P8]MCE4554698.1 efflux transporter outer membrane subunit [Pelomonas sp. P8]